MVVFSLDAQRYRSRPCDHVSIAGRETAALEKAMIDLTKETAISLREAVEALPAIEGKRPCPSTIFRWAKVGIKGQKLEHLYVGRRFCTSREAITRFLQAVSEAPSLPRPPREEAA
jgi:hypothetical protein